MCYNGGSIVKNETFRKLCIGLLILMGLDLILTIIGVEYMGMVEHNPLYMIMGTHVFIMHKIVLLGIPIILFYLFEDKTCALIDAKVFMISTINTNKICLTKTCIVSICIFSNILYAFVVINNIYVIGDVLI